MSVSTRQFGRAAVAAGLAALVLLAATPAAHAQRRAPNGYFVAPINYNPYFIPNQTPNSLSLSQYTYNLGVLSRAYGRAYANIPPYALGYNPYPQFVNYGPSFPTIAPGFPGYGGGGFNPGLYSGGGFGSSLSTYPGSYPGVGGYPGSATLTSYPGSDFSGSWGSPYTNPYIPYQDPLSGYLRGVADVTNANAQYQVTIQQAKLLQEKAKQAQIDTRRRILDEIRYERQNMPDPEAIRVADIQQALNRSRRDPPLTEIWSGKSLNSLLDHVARLQAQGQPGPKIGLEDELLKHINVTTGTGGNIGLLKDDGNLQWPQALQAAEFKDIRDRLNKKAPEAVQEVKFNRSASPATLADMRGALRQLSEALDKNIGGMSMDQNIEGRRYLRQLEDAVKALSDPNASNFFTQEWVAKGKDVASLVEHMRKSGLRFAAAVPGDEAAYRALHSALVAFDAGMSPVVSTRPPDKQP
jgi:hypothetical protein